MVLIKNYKSPIIYICLTILSILLLISLIFTLIRKLSPKNTIVTTQFDLIKTNDKVMIDDDTINVELKKYEVGDSDILEYNITDLDYVSDVKVTLCSKTIELLNDPNEFIIHSNSWLKGFDPVPTNIVENEVVYSN